MANHEPQIKANGGGEISDQAIRSFLLGQLSAGQQGHFEVRLFTDVELEARLRHAEFELSDDYAADRLNTTERELFRERFLLAANRKQILGVSQALHNRFAPLSQPTVTIGQRLGNFFTFRQPAWQYALAGTILILLFGTVLLLTKKPQVVRIADKLVPKSIRPKSRVTPTPQSSHHSTAPNSTAHVEQSPSLPAHEPPELTVQLDPNVRRDEPLTLPDDQNAVVRFQLATQSDKSISFRADLFTSLGESVFHAESLRASDTEPASVFFDVPRQNLKSGPYLIILSRVDGGLSVKVAEYHFNSR